MTYRGRLSVDEVRCRTKSSGEIRPWVVIKDPSMMFLKSRFRLSDIQYGGFDRGTVFRNERTRERRIVDAQGVARRIKSARKRRYHLAKPKLERVTGKAGSRHAIH